MINPIIIIISAAVFLSMVSVAIINKPKKPIVTGTIIVILICYVVFTFMIDNTLSSLAKGDPNPFVCFLTINDEPSYTSLAESFRVFMCCDIILIAGALLSLFIEMMLILRKGAEK